MHKQFYVYIHKKPDGTPFYVGKGHGKRAYKFNGRNLYHQAILNKYKGKIIVEVINCANELQAFDLEKIYIKQFRQYGYQLVNVTDGGEGVSGYKRTEQEKLANAERKRGNTYRRGSTHTEEAKEKNRLAHSGIKQKTESIAKRAQSNTKIRRTKKGIAMVDWYEQWQCWVAKISIKGKQKHLGYFDSYLDACAARKSAELVVYK